MGKRSSKPTQRASGVRAEKLQALTELTRLMTSESESRRVFAEVARAATILLDGATARVWIDDPARRVLRLRASFGVNQQGDQLLADHSAIPYGQGLVGGIFESRQPAYIEDISEDSRLLNRRLATEAGLHSFAGWPLIAAGRVVGVLAVLTRARRRFTDEEQRLLDLLTGQAAIAITNAELLEETEQRRRAAESLAELGRAIAQSLDLDEIGRRIVASLRTLFAAEIAGLFRRDVGSGDLTAVAISTSVPGVGERDFTSAQALRVVGLAATARQPAQTADVMSDGGLHPVPGPRQTDEHRGWSALAVPLIAQDLAVGVLAIFGEAGRHFAEDEIKLMQAFADQAAHALENARLYADTAQRRQEAEELARVARVLTESLDVASVTKGVVDSVLSLFGANSSALYLSEPDGSARALAWGGQGRAHFEPNQRFPPGVGIIGRALTTGEPAWSGNILEDTEFPVPDDMRRRIAASGNRAVLAVPMRAKGRIIGGLSIAHDTPRHFAAPTIALLQAFADQAALALENAKLYDETQRAYDELSQAQAQLVRSETLRAIGEVASGAAHHLNNLLAVITGRTELLLRQPSTSEIRKPLELIKRSAMDAAEVVRRIRSFSRAHSTPVVESLDLNQLVQEVVELTRPRWRDQSQQQGISIDVSVDAGQILPVAGEAAALREVLMNLLLNAIDALPVGGTVVLRTWSDASRICCAVSDTGTGMSPEVQQRALEPFFTTKGPKSTGLGLSVNYGIVRAHGGTLAIESAPGRGTTVTFTLPAARPSETKVQSPPEAAARGAPLRVLVIDDDLNVRETIADILRGDGHEVEEVGHGRDGLARLHNGAALDLVITDLGMPEVTGWDIIRAANDRRPPVPIGLVTGWGDDPEGRPADCPGPDFVLAKPLTHAALRLALSRIAPRSTKSGS